MTPPNPPTPQSVSSTGTGERPDWENMSDADLNRQFSRAFWNHPLDERNNLYWHDDDKTPEDENHEWKPLPNFCNDWCAVRGLLVASKYVLPIHHGAPQDQHSRCRRVIVDMLILDRVSARPPATPSKMNTGETPQVNSMVLAWQKGNIQVDTPVPADFARTLERELNTALEYKEEYRKIGEHTERELTTLHARMAEVEKERVRWERLTEEANKRFDRLMSESQPEIVSLRSSLATVEAALVQAKLEAWALAIPEDGVSPDKWERIGVQGVLALRAANTALQEQVERLETALKENATTDGNWMDKWGACRVCGGEIPHGHQNHCDIFKKETQIRDLTTTNTALSAQVEELKRDGERLDWLSKKHRSLSAFYTETEMPLWTVCGDAGHLSPRAAIDAARATPPGQKEGT